MKAKVFKGIVIPVCLGMLVLACDSKKEKSLEDLKAEYEAQSDSAFYASLRPKLSPEMEALSKKYPGSIFEKEQYLGNKKTFRDYAVQNSNTTQVYEQGNQYTITLKNINNGNDLIRLKNELDSVIRKMGFLEDINAFSGTLNVKENEFLKNQKDGLSLPGKIVGYGYSDSTKVLLLSFFRDTTDAKLFKADIRTRVSVKSYVERMKSFQKMYKIALNNKVFKKTFLHSKEGLDGHVISGNDFSNLKWPGFWEQKVTDTLSTIECIEARNDAYLLKICKEYSNVERYSIPYLKEGKEEDKKSIPMDFKFPSSFWSDHFIVRNEIGCTPYTYSSMTKTFTGGESSIVYFVWDVYQAKILTAFGAVSRNSNTVSYTGGVNKSEEVMNISSAIEKNLENKMKGKVNPQINRLIPYISGGFSNTYTLYFHSCDGFGE